MIHLTVSSLATTFFNTLYGKCKLNVNPDLIPYLVNKFFPQETMEKQVNGSRFNLSKHMLQLIDQKIVKATKCRPRFPCHFDVSTSTLDREGKAIKYGRI